MWLFTLLLYSALTASVGVLAHRLARDARVAWAAALMFGLFPLHAGVAVYVSYRAELLSALFCVWALVWFIDFDRTGVRRRRALSLAAFLLATLSKEQSFMLPVVIGAYVLWLSTDGAWRVKRAAASVLPYVGVAALVVAYRFAWQGKVGGEVIHAVPWLTRRALALASFVPSALVYPLAVAAVPPSVSRSVAVGVLSAPLLLLFRRNALDRRLAFLLTAILITTAISSIVIELPETLSTVWYFMLPSVFFTIAVAALLFPAEARGGSWRRAEILMLACYLAAYLAVFRASVEWFIRSTPTV